MKQSLVVVKKKRVGGIIEKAMIIKFIFKQRRRNEKRSEENLYKKCRHDNKISKILNYIESHAINLIEKTPLVDEFLLHFYNI